MELQSFAIGVVTMMVFAFAIITVLGILKVTSMAKSLVTLKSRLEDDERILHREIDELRQDVVTQIHHTYEDLHRQIGNTEIADRSYTDHRIDKLIDNYFEHKNSKKQVLKD